MSNTEPLAGAGTPRARQADSIVAALCDCGIDRRDAGIFAGRVLARLTADGWAFISHDLSDKVSTDLITLRDLAHVLDAQVADGAISPEGMGLVIAALGRFYPESIQTQERCKNTQCIFDGPCDECMTEAGWQSLDAKLTAWLLEYPREVVVYKTQNVGKTETPAGVFQRHHAFQTARIAPVISGEQHRAKTPARPGYVPLGIRMAYDDLQRRRECTTAPQTTTEAAPPPDRPQAPARDPDAVDAPLNDWNPAGTYPIDGTIIDVEGRGRMQYRLDVINLYNTDNYLGGWLLSTSDNGSWAPASQPTTRWRRTTPEPHSRTVTFVKTQNFGKTTDLGKDFEQLLEEIFKGDALHITEPSGPPQAPGRDLDDDGA